MEIKNKHFGYTLIEMIIVTVLTAILFPIGATILSQQFQIFSTGQNFVNADWQARIALDRMTKDIRATTNITNAGSNSITFKDLDGKTITYSLGGANNKQLIYTTAPSSQPLADNINSIEFNYFNKDGNIEIDTNNIKYISVNLNVSNNTVNFNIPTAIYLWNLKK